MSQIDLLYADVQAHRDGSAARLAPRTCKLIAEGRAKMAKKLGEEAVEVAIEALSDSASTTVEESADLIYNLVVLWADMGIDPSLVWAEMARRRSDLGIAEKLPKPPKPRRASVRPRSAP